MSLPINPAGRAIRRRTLLGGSAAVASALAFGGCRSAVNAGTGSNQGGTKTLNVGIPGDLNVPKIYSPAAINFPVLSLLYDGLLEYDPSTGEAVEALATKRAFSSDHRELVLTLRDDVKFHTGRPFTAEDAVFSLTVVNDVKYVPTPSIPYIDTFKATGDHELTITMKRPLPSLPNLLTYPLIIDEETFDKIESGEQVVGTGPFSWQSYVAGNEIKLAKNPDYWGGEVKLDAVTLKVLGTGPAMVAGLRSGSVHLTTSMVPADAKSFEGQDGFQVFTADPIYTSWQLNLNCSVKPLDNKAVRQAIAYSLDKDRILAQVFGGIGRTTSTLVAPPMPGVTAEQLDHYRYDLAKAKSLLADAGVSGGKLTIQANANNTTQIAIMNIVQYNLTELGFTVDARPMPPADFAALGQTGYAGLWIVPMDSLQVMMPAAAVRRASDPVNGPFKLKAPEHKGLAEDMVFATDPANATQVWLKYVLDQAFQLPLIHSYYTGVVGNGVTGAKTDALARLDLAAVDLG